MAVEIDARFVEQWRRGVNHLVYGGRTTAESERLALGDDQFRGWVYLRSHLGMTYREIADLDGTVSASTVARSFRRGSRFRRRRRSWH